MHVPTTMDGDKDAPAAAAVTCDRSREGHLVETSVLSPGTGQRGCYASHLVGAVAALAVR